MTQRQEMQMATNTNEQGGKSVFFAKNLQLVEALQILVKSTDFRGRQTSEY